MARGRRRRSRRKPKQLNPEDVLEAGAQVDVREIIELIRRINPTDRGLSTGEARQHYQHKAALQSLLVNRFAYDLEVVAEQGELVLLRHMPSGLDACHALISELDEEAGRWVRRQLDEQESEKMLAPAANHGEELRLSRAEARESAHTMDAADRESTPAELLRLGQAALDEYDFDRARWCHEQAFHGSGGSPEPAKALLELLVEHLAAYQDALDCLEDLSVEAAGDARVRTLLGLAAAHASNPDRAQELVRDLEGPQVAGVHVILASDAIRAGDDEEAARHIRAAQKNDPAIHDVHRLEQELATLRARKWRPAEEELSRMMDRGDLATAERAARDLLDRWPESAVARRVLRSIRDRKRRKKAGELLSRADEALERGVYSRAADLLERAMAMGAAEETVGPRLARARELEGLRIERERQEDLKRRVAEVQRLLGQKDRREGLVSYLRAAPEERALVRQRMDLQLLWWLDQLDTDCRPQEAADAVLALQDVTEGAVEEEPEGVLNLLRPHQDLLLRVDHGRRILERAQEQHDRARQEQMRALLDHSESALRAGRTDRARELLEKVDVQSMPREERRAIKDLSTRIDRLRDMKQQAERFEQLLAADDLIEARETARRLAAGWTEEREVWEPRVRQLTERIRRRWRVRIDEGLVEAELLRDTGLHEDKEQTSAWLTPDGEELLAPLVLGRWVFIRVVQVSTGRTTCRVSLRTPEAIGFVHEIQVNARSLWMVGEGWLLQLDRRSWDVRSWKALADLFPEDTILDHMTFIPGSRYMWASTRRGDRAPGLTVIDMERWRVHRELPDYDHVIPLPGGREPMAACIKYDAGTTLLQPRGAQARWGKTKWEREPTGAAFHPDGRHLLLLHAGETLHELPEEECPLELSTIAPDGAITNTIRFNDARAGMINAVGTGRDPGLTAVIFTTDDASMLVVLRASGAGMKEAYRLEVPRDTFLLQDQHARMLVAVAPVDRGLQILPLGSDPPDIESWRRVGDWSLPDLKPPFYCSRPASPINAQAMALCGMLECVRGPQVTGWVQNYLEEHREQSDELVALHRALKLHPDVEARDHGAELVLQVSKQHLGDPAVALLHAGSLADREEWDEVSRLLDPLQHRTEQEELPQHYYHLLGLALFFADRVDEALAVWKSGEERTEGSCDLASYIHLTTPLPSVPLPESWGSDEPRVRQLLGAVRTADMYLDQDQPARAMEAVDRPVVWHAQEIQSLARLAEACLRLPDHSLSFRFNKAMCLAKYLDTHRPFWKEEFKEIPFPGATWDRERLDELAARARAWLEDEERQAGFS